MSAKTVSPETTFLATIESTNKWLAARMENCLTIARLNDGPRKGINYALLSSLILAYLSGSMQHYQSRFNTNNRARALSQTAFGANRDDTGAILVPEADEFLPIGKRSWFSHVANVCQGGRKQPVETQFIYYVAAMTGVPFETVAEMVEYDESLHAAFVKANVQK